MLEPAPSRAASQGQLWTAQCSDPSAESDTPFAMHRHLQRCSECLMQAACRNAIDWLGSLYNTPWGAANHCNVSLHEFIVREWGPGELKGQHHPHCPKYEAPEGEPCMRTVQCKHASAMRGCYRQPCVLFAA